MVQAIRSNAKWEPTHTTTVGVHAVEATGDEGRECYACNKKGHLKRNCPERVRNSEELKQTCRVEGCPENGGNTHKYIPGKCRGTKKRKNESEGTDKTAASTTRTDLTCKYCPTFRNHTTEQCMLCDICARRGHTADICRHKKSMTA